MFNTAGWGSMLCLWSGPLGFNCWISVAPAFQESLAVEFSFYFNSVLFDLDLYDCCFDA